jgi:hypothetical protein
VNIRRFDASINDRGIRRVTRGVDDPNGAPAEINNFAVLEPAIDAIAIGLIEHVLAGSLGESPVLDLAAEHRLIRQRDIVEFRDSPDMIEM